MKNYLLYLLKPLYSETREAKRKELKKDEMPKAHLVVYDILNSIILSFFKIYFLVNQINGRQSRRVDCHSGTSPLDCALGCFGNCRFLICGYMSGATSRRPPPYSVARPGIGTAPPRRWGKLRLDHKKKRRSAFSNLHSAFIAVAKVRVFC